jgi:hypothetical protein
MREDDMKRQLWKVVALGAALLATSSAVGQANEVDATAEIPFPFTVASHTFQPGRYTVTRMSDALLRISNAHESVLVLTSKVKSKAPEDTGKMIFHRCGDSNFLAELWVASSETGRKLLPSRVEYQLVRRQTGMALAVLRIAR